MFAYRRPFPLLLLIGLILPELTALTVAAEPIEAEVLVIRPEYLPVDALSDTKTQNRGRNPFAWGPAQTNRIAKLAETSGVDPFLNLKLSGIIWSSKDPVVVINKQALRTGDKINGVTVSEITKDAVVLAVRETRRTMRLSDPALLLVNPAEGN